MQIAEAIERLYWVLELTPAHLNARYLLMDIYSWQSDRIHLREIANETLRLIPNDPTTLAYLQAFVNINQTLEEAETSVHKDPTVENLFQLGFLYLQAEQYEEAVTINRRIITMDPKNTEAYNNLGVAYNYLKQWEPAITALEKALKLKPDYNLAARNLAFAKTHLNTEE